MDCLFSGKQQIRIDPSADTALLADLFRNYTGRTCEAEFLPGDPRTAVCGQAPLPALGENDEYVLQIAPTGFCVIGQDRVGMIRGLLALFLRIRPQKTGFALSAETVHGAFSVSVRMAHLCVFPENTFPEIRKWVRAFGMLQYTHLIVEFWGTFPFESFPEYGWAEYAFSKPQVRTLVREGKALGMEMIPMLNVLGHASGCRLRSGKHAVLNRHPEYAYLFSPDGWAWNFTDPEVCGRLAQMRSELYDVFDDPRCFHLGLDEAYIYRRGYVSAEAVADYFGKAVREILDEGKTPLLWADMLIPKSALQTVGEVHSCAQEDKTAQRMLDALPKEAILCDWEYEARQAPVEPSVYLKEHGFRVVGCSWYKTGNIAAYVETAKTAPLFGAMLTTWHTLSANARSLLQFACLCGLPKTDWWQYAPERSIMAAILRGVMPVDAVYADFGFAATQIQPMLD